MIRINMIQDGFARNPTAEWVDKNLSGLPDDTEITLSAAQLESLLLLAKHRAHCEIRDESQAAPVHGPDGEPATEPA